MGGPKKDGYIYRNKLLDSSLNTEDFFLLAGYLCDQKYLHARRFRDLGKKHPKEEQSNLKTSTYRSVITID